MLQRFILSLDDNANPLAFLLMAGLWSSLGSFTDQQ
jgi:hypothetical protein